MMAPPKPPYPDSATTPYYPPNDTKAPPKTPYFLPATTYQPPSHSHQEPIPMLDSTPVPKPRSPRFHEHISELADTSSPAPAQWSGSSYLHQDPVTSGNSRTETILPSNNERLEEARRRHHELHLMSWNNVYDNNRAAELQHGGIEATIGRSGTQQSGGSEAKKQGEVSPDDSNSPLDRKFIVSPMGTLDRDRR